MRRRRYLTISIYIAKEYLISFAVSFLFFFFIFFVNQILLLAQKILAKNVPVHEVLLLLLYSLPMVIYFSAPFASLVGALMAVGRLSSDNEIQACQASGIPYFRIFSPLLVIGLILSMVSFSVNDYLQPAGNQAFYTLYKEILNRNPAMELEPYSVNRYQDIVIITGNVQGNTIDQIMIIDSTAEKDERIITARQAVFLEETEHEDMITFELVDVFSQTADNKEREKFEYFQSELMVYNILVSNFIPSRSTLSPSEMTSADVYDVIKEKSAALELRMDSHENRILFDLVALSSIYTADLDSSNQYHNHLNRLNHYEKEIFDLEQKEIYDRSLQIHRLEFNKKFSLPFACLAFVVFAFPVGMFSKRSGRSVGFGIGLFVAIFYWSMFFVGQTLTYRVNFDPFWAVWIPNGVIILLGIFFYYLRFRR